MKKRAFTIIEVIVVITIIAVLAAILTPVFASSKRSAKVASCANNLSQLSKSVLLYIADSDQRYPVAYDYADWHVYRWSPPPNRLTDLQASAPSTPILSALLAPYGAAPPLWRCPEDSGGHLSYYHLDGSFTPPVSPSAYHAHGTSYASNPEVMLLGAADPLNCTLDTANFAPLSNSEIPLLVDASQVWHLRAGEVEKWQHKSTNVAYADGHVKFKSLFGVDPYAAGWAARCGG